MEKGKFNFVCAAVAVAFANVAIAGNAPYDLTIERKMSPVGVDVHTPRFGWKLPVGGNAMQKAYRVMVFDSPESATNGSAAIWDSKEVASRENIETHYAGPRLESSKAYYYRVKVQSEDGSWSDWSEPARWVTGIMPGDEWKAKWIGPAKATREDVDMRGAKWVTAAANEKGETILTKTIKFNGAKDGEYVEMVHAANAEHTVFINGQNCDRHTGMVYKGDKARFRNIVPYLKVGDNEIKVQIPKTDTPSFIAKIEMNDGRVYVTDETWGKTLGGVRETSWGEKLHLRREVNSPAFEKRFEVAPKTVASAYLHITGVGFYEAYLNGKKIGDRVLEPAPTAYDKHVLYSTYDMTSELRGGLNDLKVLVGHGWYDVRAVSTWNFEDAPWRDFPRMIAQLEITYSDGEKKTIVSDKSWRQVKSPVGYDDIREGEVVGGENVRAVDLDAKEIYAEEVAAPKGKLIAEDCMPAKVMRKLAPKKITKMDDGKYIVQIPENIAGWIRLRIKGAQKGDVISIRYDERLHENGTPAIPSSGNGLRTINVWDNTVAYNCRLVDEHFQYPASYDVCAKDEGFQTDRYIAKGEAVEYYEPRFTYNGFQYVIISGLRGELGLEDVEARIVHTSFDTIGSFESSDDTLNQLVKMGERAYKSNYTDGYPTDCPHREKNGWTGDASIASELAQYCFENTAGYEKWVRDLTDAQNEQGLIPGIVPTSGWGFRWGNGPTWDSAMSVIPWNLWCYRNDRKVLDDVYPAWKKYVEGVYKTAKGDLIQWGLDDWIPVDKNHKPSQEFTVSCYFYQTVKIVANIAAIRGETSDAAKYEELAAKLRAAIRAKYNKGDGTFDNGLQTAQAMAIAYRLYDNDEELKKVGEKLVKAVEDADCHLDVGILGAKQIFRSLSFIGRTDLALKLLVNPTKPSFVEWLQKGGTTLWEDWSIGRSSNHIMFGDFVAWVYQYLGGIRLNEKPESFAAVLAPVENGFRDVVIAPAVVEELDWMKTAVNGPNGEIKSSWKRENGKVIYTIAVPGNTRATIRLPGMEEKKVGPGTYSFIN